MIAAQGSKQKVAKLRSDYRRAVAWGTGQWSDRAAAAIETADAEPPAGERGAAYYSEFFVLLARHWGVGDMHAAAALGKKCSGHVQELKKQGKLRWAHSLGRMVGLNYSFLGECQAAYATLEEVTDYFDAYSEVEGEPLGVMDDQVAASSYMAVAAFQIGKIGEALAREQIALARASKLGHLGSAVNCYCARLLFYEVHLQRPTLLRDAEQFLGMAEQLGVPYYLSAARMFLTYASGLESRPSIAAANLRAQLGEYMETGARMYVPAMLGRIAELEMRANEWGNARTRIDEALKLVGGGCDPSRLPPYIVCSEHISRNPLLPTWMKDATC